MIKTLFQVKNKGHETLYNSLKVSSFHNGAYRKRLHGFMEKTTTSLTSTWNSFSVSLDKFRKMHGCW